MQLMTLSAASQRYNSPTLVDAAALVNRPFLDPRRENNRTDKAVSSGVELLTLAAHSLQELRAVFAEQQTEAEAIRAAHDMGLLPNDSSLISRLKQAVLDWIEGPWAPDHADLPQKRSPVACGNSELPFYEAPRDRSELRARTARITELETGAVINRLSTWTTSYEYRVPLPREHAALDGLTVLHLSDVHLLKGNSRPIDELAVIDSYLERTGYRLDLVFFSGDLITRSTEDLDDRAQTILQRIASRAQHSFFTLGNHDYHGHTPALVSEWISRAGFHDITNRSAELRRAGTPFAVYGVDDAYFGRPQAPSHDDVPQDRFNVLVTHNLDAIRANFPRNFNCMFSGHTHGGEAWIKAFGYVMKAWNYLDDVNRNIRGWSMLSDSCYSFVHPGMARYYIRHPGLWLPPGVVFHTFCATTK